MIELSRVYGQSCGNWRFMIGWRCFYGDWWLGLSPSKLIISERVGSKGRKCAICRAEVESYFHMFEECQGILGLVLQANGDTYLINGQLKIWKWWSNYVSNQTNNQTFWRMEAEMVSVFFSSMFNFYWNYRNFFVHSIPMRMENLIFHFNQLVEEFICCRGRRSEQEVSGVDNCSEFLRIRWIRPLEGWYKINTYATFKLGRAAIGAVFHDFRGKLIFLASKVIKCGSVHAEQIFLMWNGHRMWLKRKVGWLSCGLRMPRKSSKRSIQIVTPRVGILDMAYWWSKKRGVSIGAFNSTVRILIW